MKIKTNCGKTAILEPWPVVSFSVEIGNNSVSAILDEDGKIIEIVYSGNIKLTKI
tara:strand:+ start:42 stop:206 length:165 start_codon:yes stop_codon:yes gene_type:complete